MRQKATDTSKRGIVQAKQTDLGYGGPDPGILGLSVFFSLYPRMGNQCFFLTILSGSPLSRYLRVMDMGESTFNNFSLPGIHPSRMRGTQNP